LSAVGNYTIEMTHQTLNDENTHHHSHPHQHTISPRPVAENSIGNYYCPMQCEGDKLYDKPGSCPVCGMNLEKVPELSPVASQYTCPMHPEIIRDKPGSCPLCGMDLVPITPTDEEDGTYKELLKKFKIALLFTVP